MWTFFLQIVAGISGLYLADRYIQGVEFTGPLFFIPKSLDELSIFFSSLIFVGAFLGFLNSFIKPILNKIALPLRIITLNIFSLIIAMGMVWITEIIFPELDIHGIIPLFWTTLIVWGIGLILLKWMPGKKSTT
jgi:putative membrane protein